MKKRKPPFLMVTLLVAFVGVAFAMSGKVMTASGQKEPEPEIQQPHPDEHEDKPKQSTEEIKARAKGGLTPNSSTKPGDNPVADTAKMRQFEFNTIMKEASPGTTKPVKTDSDTSTQWWDQKK